MKLNKELLEEILADSNYNSIKEIEQDIDEGHIEIYESKKVYEYVGYKLEFKECYSLLSNGSIAHYIHM